MARRVTILVNGKRHRVQATPDTPLLYVLRNELSLHGPRFGCGLAQCGACTVHINGAAVRSCVVPVSAARGKRVRTLESLAGGRPHPVVQAFIDEGAAQCGYCINGMVMQSIAFLRQNPHPTEAQIKKALNANICRCGTHYRILRAVQRAAKAKA
ncbi:MAG TPA: (2Fe-2S)-binding protein [Gemmataceae bacterium]|nr:(2Fe-2S)-binding protein [Gemmataceae bacterium]